MSDKVLPGEITELADIPPQDQMVTLLPHDGGRLIIAFPPLTHGSLLGVVSTIPVQYRFLTRLVDAKRFMINVAANFFG